VPKKKLSLPKPQKETVSLGTREVTVNAYAKLPWLILGYDVPSLVTAKNAWEPYALDVLASLLDGSESARNQKELIRNLGIATDTGVGYDLSARLSTLFILMGTPAPDHTIIELKDALLSQLKKFQTTPVTQEELARVKSQVIAYKKYSLDSILYQATEIGRFESVGLNWRVAEDYVKNVQAVTPEQIQEVAQRYFINERLTTATLKPKTTES